MYIRLLKNPPFLLIEKFSPFSKSRFYFYQKAPRRWREPNGGWKRVRFRLDPKEKPRCGVVYGWSSKPSKIQRDLVTRANQ